MRYPLPFSRIFTRGAPQCLSWALSCHRRRGTQKSPIERRGPPRARDVHSGSVSRRKGGQRGCARTRRALSPTALSVSAALPSMSRYRAAKETRGSTPLGSGAGCTSSTGKMNRLGRVLTTSQRRPLIGRRGVPDNGTRSQKQGRLSYQAGARGREGGPLGSLIDFRRFDISRPCFPPLRRKGGTTVLHAKRGGV